MDTKEIEKVIDEYKEAVLEKLQANKEVENSQLKLQKAQKRVSMAFNEMLSLRLL
jgi:hypothetical protein